MAWIESHQTRATGFWIRSLARRLRVSHPAAVGMVHLLWHYCAQAGVGEVDRLDLEVATEWDGDIDVLIEALHHCAYIRPIDDGERFEVVGWWEIGGRRLHIHRERAKMTEGLRRAVIDHFDSVCQECEELTSEPHVDHVIPLARGGRTVWDNLQVLCRRHNLEKGDR